MSKFRGTMNVFRFTLASTMKRKSYISTTILFALVLFAAPVLINYFSAKSSAEETNDIIENVEDEEFSVKTVIMQDNSEFADVSYEQIDIFSSEIAGKNAVKLELADKSLDTQGLIKLANEKGEDSLIIQINKDITDEILSYNIDAIIPEESLVNKDDANVVADSISMYLNMCKYTNTGLNEEQLAKATFPVSVRMRTLNEGDTNTAVAVIKTFAPMFIGFVLYMMIVVYSQAIAKGMMEEKTSKLLESLLTNVKSYALITGKLTAMILSAIVQVVVWIISPILGQIAGVAITKKTYPDYKSEIEMIVDMLRESNEGLAFSAEAIIVAIIAIVFGFIMFCVLAGLTGSFLTKPEDMSSVMVWFNYACVAGFFISYFAPMIGNPTLTMLSRYFPFAIPFTIPAEVILGSIGIGQAFISIGIMAVVCVIAIVLTGKIYNAMVLYNGEKVTFKNIGKIIKG